MIRTVLFWVFWIWVLVWILRDPAAAGASVHRWISDIITFLNGLTAH